MHTANSRVYSEPGITQMSADVHISTAKRRGILLFRCSCTCQSCRHTAVTCCQCSAQTQCCKCNPGHGKQGRSGLSTAVNFEQLVMRLLKQHCVTKSNSSRRGHLQVPAGHTCLMACAGGFAVMNSRLQMLLGLLHSSQPVAARTHLQSPEGIAHVV